MITRSRARLIANNSKVNKYQFNMNGNTVDSNETEQPNNQLGMVDLFEDDINNIDEIIMVRGQTEQESVNKDTQQETIMEISHNNNENNEIQPSAQAQTAMSELQSVLLAAISSLREDSEKKFNDINKRFDNIEENNHKISQDIKADIQEIKENNKVIQDELKQQKEENKKRHEHTQQQFVNLRLEVHNIATETRAELNKSISEVRVDINDVKKSNKHTQDQLTNLRNNVDNNIEKLKNDAKQIRVEVRDSREEIHALQTRVEVVQKETTETINKQHETLRKDITNNSKNIKKLNTEVKSEVQTMRQEIEEKERKIAEMKADQERIQRRMNEVEIRPVTIMQNLEAQKEIKFDGNEEYPMNFLRELDELQEKYHAGDNIRWIQRHLDGDAKYWWQLIEQQIQGYTEFRVRFTEKYWSSQIQDAVRDNMYYGHYNARSGITRTQYLERQVVKCRQLIPPMTDHHIVRKLSRHFGSTVETAAVTRGVTEIGQLSALLEEFGILWSRNNVQNPRNGEERREREEIKPKQEKENKPAHHQQYNRYGREQQSNRFGNQQRNQYEKRDYNYRNEAHPVVNEIAAHIQQQASTSKNVRTSSADRTNT